MSITTFIDLDKNDNDIRVYISEVNLSISEV